MRVRLLIDGIDRSAFLTEREWEIEDNAWGVLDHTRFVLDDPTKVLSAVEGKDCIIEDFADANTRFFGGVLTQVARQTRGLGRLLTCTALGWQWKLMRVTHNRTWRHKADSYIINNATEGLFAHADLSAFNATTHVQTGVSDTIFHQAKQDSTQAILDALGDMSGFAWYVDGFKFLHYKPYGVESHAFHLSDDPDNVASFAALGLVDVVDITKLFNRVQVVGGRKRVLAATETYPNFSTNKFTQTNRRWDASEGNATIVVAKNTGTEGAPTWTAQAVGNRSKTDDVANLGGTIDVLWDPLGTLLEWATAPPTFATNSFRITGDFMTEYVAEAPDQASIDQYGPYTVAVKDQTLNSDEAVLNRAQAELRKHVKAGVRASLRTTKEGIVAGKSIRLVNSILGIDRTDLVEKVVTRLLGGTVAEFELTLVRQPEAV